MALNITNTTVNTIISGTNENDSIINIGSNVTINLGGGDDTLFNGLDNDRADNVLINTGEGNNNVTVQAGSENVTIVGGNGNNRLESVSPKTLIIAGDGQNTLTYYTGSDNGTIVGGAGDEIINAVGYNVTINAGAGNDTIRTFRNAFDITINGGAGDDSIIVAGDVGGNINHNVIQYASSDGNDTLVNLTANDSVQVLGEIENAALSGNDVIMTISGGGTLTWYDTINKQINLLDAAGNLTETIFAGDRVGDTIVNDTVITGTAGNDSIFNEGARVTINALDGNDSITSTGNYDIINTGDGNNWVSVAAAGSNVTINTGNGNNIVRTDENGVGNLINFGNGQNTYVGSDSYNTIIGGAGADGITLHNGSSNSYVDAGAGADTIAVGHDNITVNAGDGNDVILIYRDAENSVINAGKGDDTITVYNNQYSQTYLYANGDGNDIITGFDDNDTLQISGVSSINSVISGDDVILGIGDGSITLAGSSDKTLNIQVSNIINLTEGQHTVTTDNVVYNGTEGVDLIRVEAANSTVYGYGGDDHLKNFAANVLLDGGDGDDQLVVDTTDGITTLVGGKGDDRIDIMSGKVLINYNDGDGNDIIGGLSSDTTINIANGTIDSVTVSGSDYILNIGDGTITLQNAISSTFYVNGQKVGAEWTKSGNNYIYTSTARNDWTQSASFTVSGSDFKDSNNDNAPDGATVSAFRWDSNTGILMAGFDKIGGVVTLNGSAIGVIGDDDYDVHFTARVIDGAPANVVEYAKSQNIMRISDGATVNTTYNELIELDSTAKVHIIGQDNVRLYTAHGQDKTQVRSNTAYDAEMVADTLKSISGLSDGFEVTVVTADNVQGTLGFESDGGAGKIIYSGKAINDSTKSGTWTIESSAVESLSVGNILSLTSQDGLRVNMSGLSGSTTINGVDLGVAGDDNYSASYVDGYMKEIHGLSDGASLTNNAGLLNGYAPEANASVQIEAGDFIVFKDEVGHTVWPVSVTSSQALDLTTKNGKLSSISGLTAGYNLRMTNTDLGIYSGLSSNLSEVTFKSDGGQGTLKLGSATYTLSGDSEFTFKFDTTGEVAGLEGFDGMIAGSGNLEINGKTATLSNTLKITDVPAALRRGDITASDGQTITDIFGTNYTVKAATNGNVSGDGILVGYGNEATLTGGSGDDILITKATNSTLTGGAGKDTFIGGVGLVNTTITDYTESEDVVFHGQPFKNISINGKIIGNDYTYIVGARRICVKEGASKTIKTVDVNGEIRYFGNYLTLDDNDSAKVTAQSKVVTIDASHRTANIKITGNAKANTIIGGTGTTTMTGGSGADVFVHTSGNDYITDYKSNVDIIDLGSSTITGFDIKSSNLILNTSEGNITVKGGRNKAITLKDSTGTTTKTYPTISAGLKYNTSCTVITADNIFTDDVIDLSKYVSNVKIVNASKLTSSIEIIGNDNDNSLRGGNGDDTLIAGVGSDTLTGGNGSDTFVFTAEGNATITDYNENDDTIKIEGSIKSAKANGDNFIFKVDNKSLTIKNGASEVIKAQVDDNYYIRGNSSANTLIGSSGDDTLTGGAGKDVFIYTGGNDYITDYSAKDTIQLNSGTLSNASLNGANVVLSIDDGTVTLKNGKNKNITIYDANSDEMLTLKLTTKSSNYEEILFNEESFNSNELEDILPNKALNQAITVSDKLTANTLKIETETITLTKNDKK